MKKLYQSRTFWIAVIQAIIGVLTVAFSEIGAVDALGYVAVLKSFVDVALRIDTDTKIQLDILDENIR